MSRSAECADALQNLCWVLLLKQIDGEERIVLLEVQRRRLAGAQK
jgi:hypothetical protein